MTELRQKLLDIIASYAPPDVKRSQFEDAKLLRDLPIDSIAMLGAFDEIEEEFGIKFGGAAHPDMPVDDFVALMARLIAEKNA
jgi:acyl carrier protein